MLPEGKCRYIDGQIYPDGNFYVLDTQHIKHNGNELKSALNSISTDISNKVDKVAGKGLSTEDYTTAEKNKLSGIEANANNYVHPTTSGNKHIPSGGSSGKILGWSADGTAAWVDPTGGGSVDTVYIGTTEYAPDANGKVTLPTYPTTLPASDVYSWAKDSTKPSYTASEVGAIATTSKGANNGVAELDSSGKVPSSQLPSYVDDVLEYSAKASFPTTGETGKIYVDTSTNKTYRWSGSAYVEISASLALGETSSTAYYGDKGKTAYNHSQVTSGNPHNVTKSDVGLGNVGNFKAVSTVASQGLSDTEKSNARANIGAGTGTYSKPSGGIPKTDLASGVQTSLGLADGALQHSTVTGSPDLDTYLTTGVYHIATIATHAPTTTHATLFVDATVGTAYQIFKPDSSDTTWYTRHRSGSAWTSWVAMKFTDTTYSAATTSAAGLMSATDKSKLDGIASGAQVNSITGVKGNAESSYRTGNVNLTAANIGAAASSHTHNYAASSSAGGPATSVLTNGADVKLGTSETSSNDSGDIVFLYGNSSEKLRIYTGNEYTAKAAPLCRERDASGNTLYDGCLVLGDGTGASGTWNITSASANKLNTNAGSVTQPVYFNNGVPTVTSYSLAKSVPSDAKFTDTTYTFGTGDSWGQIKITPSGGSAQNVSVNDTISEWTSGSVNNVTKSCTLRFGRYCTDLPQDGAVWLVDTKLSDANTGYQTAVALTINTVDGNLVGKMYVRIKASGTWSNWRLLTN